MIKTLAFFGTLFQFQGKCNQEFLLNRYTVLQLKQVLLIALEPNTWFYNIVHHPFTIFKFFHVYTCKVHTARAQQFSVRAAHGFAPERAATAATIRTELWLRRFGKSGHQSSDVRLFK